jgi:hypothetical protein
MSVPHAPGVLVLRRGGGLWGIPNAQVEGLARQAGGYRVTTGAGALAADEILGVVADLAVRRVPAVIRRFWPEASVGMAVHAGQPVVMVDPLHPPAALRIDGGERLDGSPDGPEDGGADGRDDEAAP